MNTLYLVGRSVTDLREEFSSQLMVTKELSTTLHEEFNNKLGKRRVGA